MKRFAYVLAAALLATAVWSQSQPLSGVAAPSPVVASHHATLGPLAEAALSATVHGHKLPAAWVRGRATKQGTTYGVFLRGTTTAGAIAQTGAVPGTVLSVGATADATLAELKLLAALPGITEVELAGQATKQLDVSVPAIHASEPGHASNAGVPHLWSGTGGSDGPYMTSEGGKVVWETGANCSINAARVPVLHDGLLYDRNVQEGTSSSTQRRVSMSARSLPTLRRPSTAPRGSSSAQAC